MPDVTQQPTHVLTTDAVRWGINTLGALKLHSTFVMYLYLRMQDRAGTLATASAKSPELTSLIAMSGNPSKPYYFPLIDRGQRTGKPLASFWRADNISGSWSPGSIRRLQGGGWLGASNSAYAMPPNHADLALAQMLYGQPVSAVAIGSFFLRNDGFVLRGAPSVSDLVAGMRRKFDYPSAADAEFAQLFTVDDPGVPFEWFEPFVSTVPDVAEPTDV